MMNLISTRRNQKKIIRYYLIRNKMINIDMTESLLQQASKNQFLLDGVIYEKCPHCERQFFEGKLAYHLKLCTPENPMYKTPLKSNRKATYKDLMKNNNQYLDKTPAAPDINCYQQCQCCHSKLPTFMIVKHLQKCQNKKKFGRQTPVQHNTQADFRVKSDRSKQQLPKIHFTPKKNESKNMIVISRYVVKIRDQLRCFRKAEQVQKVTCSFCGRKFSTEASLRHIPICENLKINQQLSIGIKKKNKSIISGRKLKNIEDEKLLQPKSIEKIVQNSSFIDRAQKLKQANMTFQN